MTAITVNNISKKFRIPHQKKSTLLQRGMGLISRQQDFEEFWAIKNVSFDVDKGESFGIIGRNGSGKSTLLKILARVLYPDSGTIITQGIVAPFLELGVGFQPELTAAENIYIYSSVLGMTRRRVDAVRDQILEFAELKKFEDMKLKNFSSGMYLRLAFSTAIHCNPDIILIDEVLAVGDESFQKKSLNKIRDFQNQGKTIVLVTHSLQAVKDMCEKAMLIDNGHVISQGDTEDVIDNYLSMIESEEDAHLNVAQAQPDPSRMDKPVNMKLIGANQEAEIYSCNSPDYFILSKYKADKTGVMHNMLIKCAAQGNVKVAIYADDNGEPGILLNSVDFDVNVDTGWNCIPFPPTEIKARRKYWLALCTDNQIAAVKSSTYTDRRFRPAEYASFKFPNPAGTNFIISTIYSDIIAGWTDNT